MLAEVITDEKSPNFLQGLNPPQLEAATHVTGPILVLAGAGSGKTRVLTHRIANLVLHHNARPESIFAVTFTNKAANEMKKRLYGLLGDKAQRLWISTFHSSGLKILRHNAHRIGYKNDFAVYDDDDTKSVIKRIVKELNIDEDKYPPDSFHRAIDSAKNNGRSPSDVAQIGKSLRSDLDSEVYQRYQKELLSANAMDFGDLLLNTLRVFKECPEALSYYRNLLDFILVDEFQDTNKIQYDIIKLLSTPKRNLFVVGDDDQSIYAFRGATVRNILDFEKDYAGAKTVTLDQNYRSTANILEASHSVISENKQRKPKKLWTDSGEGENILTFIGQNEDEEAEFIAEEISGKIKAGISYDQIAILYRTNAQTRALEEALMRRSIPYKIFGGLRFYERKEIKDILGYLRLIANSSDNQSFQRVVNTPPRGIGAQALVAIAQNAQAKSTSFLESCFELSERARALQKFTALYLELKHQSENIPLGELVAEIVEKSEYGPRLKEMKDPSAESRIENLRELAAIARTFEGTGETSAETLRIFLDQIALTSGADRPSTQKEGGKEGDCVSLMTLHLAKGLEFPVVFLTGLEEGLLPHYRAITDPTQLEEERRLAYVGITRAMKWLYFTRCNYRGMFAGYASSQGGYRVVSRFVKQIPEELFSPARKSSLQEGTFIDGLSMSYVEYTDREESVSYQKRKFTPQVPVSSSKFSAERIKELLIPADQLKKQPAQDPAYAGKPLAELKELGAGVQVIHPTFGKGVIEFVEGNDAEARIAAKFDGLEQVKKLVFRHSKLVLQ